MIRHPWTPDELATLRELYPTTRAKDIAAQIGRPLRSVLEKAWREGMKKPRETIARLARESMADPSHPGRAFHFPKGHGPWNAGKKGWDAGGRSAETRYQKGNLSGRAKVLLQPLGALRVSKDGYLEQKYTHAGRGSQRWRGVHRIVWEAAHGPIPPRHVVRFLPGQFTTELDEITVDRLELLSMRENMLRNTVHNLPKEIAQLVQLRGALVRKINRITQSTTEEMTP